MAKNFRMVISKGEGRVTVGLAGDIDGSSAAEACYQLEKLRLGACALDFSRVERMDGFAASMACCNYGGERRRACVSRTS